MGMIDRLGDVIRSYLTDDDPPLFTSSANKRTNTTDPDVQAAFDELDAFLNKGRAAGFTEDPDASTGSRTGDAHTRRTTYGNAAYGAADAVPDEVCAAFTELGVPVGASPDVCKAAHKKLLNIHHPDRHAGHPGNMRKATEKSARINAAYDRIERWREQGC